MYSGTNESIGIGKIYVLKKCIKIFYTYKKIILIYF